MLRVVATHLDELGRGLVEVTFQKQPNGWWDMQVRIQNPPGTSWVSLHVATTPVISSAVDHFFDIAEEKLSSYVPIGKLAAYREYLSELRVRMSTLAKA